MTALDIAIIIWTIVAVKGLYERRKQEYKIMAKLSELAGILQSIADELAKAQTEIVDALAKLGTTDPDISPAGQAQLDRLTALAKALDDIVPDAPTPPGS